MALITTFARRYLKATAEFERLCPSPERETPERLAACRSQAAQRVALNSREARLMALMMRSDWNGFMAWAKGAGNPL